VRQGDASIELKICIITGTLGLRVGYQVRHNSEAPAGIEKTDTLTTLGLQYETK